MIKENEKMLDFKLLDENNNYKSLNDYKDKMLIIYFYSKDNTSACTCQALGYKQLYDEFKKLNTEIIGISKDTVSSHNKFKLKHELPFSLLTDTDRIYVSKLGLLKEKTMYGKKVIGTVRSSVIIKNGIVIKFNYNVKGSEDAINNLNYLKTINIYSKN